MTNQTFNLDLIPKGVSPVVHVSQYDQGQTWAINLYKDGVAYSPPVGTAAIIVGTKPDNYGFEYPCTISGNVVTATLEQQMTAVAGDVISEIRLTNVSEDIVGTLNFIIRVEPAALADDTIISETDISAIEQALELIEEIPQIEGQLLAIQYDAEAWAVGTKDGVPVTQDDEQYENNAKYWATNGMYITDAQWTSVESILT